MGFIDTMRGEGFAVETICTVLREQGVQVAARTYRAWSSPRRQVAARTVARLDTSPMPETTPRHMDTEVLLWAESGNGSVACRVPGTAQSPPVRSQQPTTTEPEGTTSGATGSGPLARGQSGLEGPTSGGKCGVSDGT